MSKNLFSDWPDYERAGQQVLERERQMTKKNTELSFTCRCDAITQKYDSKGNKAHLQIDLTDTKEQLRILADNDETFYKQGDLYNCTLVLEKEGTTPTHIEDFVEEDE